MWNNAIDIDGSTQIPIKLAIHALNYHPTMLVRVSSSGTGLHLISKDQRCEVCELLGNCDQYYINLRENGKGVVLFSRKGSKKVGEWKLLRSEYLC